MRKNIGVPIGTNHLGAPHYPIRDHDGAYGLDFRERVKRMDIEEVVIVYRSPRPSPDVELLIGSIRRECLNHVIVFNEARLIRILTSYFAYYPEARTHLSHDRNAPIPREIEPSGCGRVVSIPRVGGLYHWHTRAA
jgi:putative transposase